MIRYLFDFALSFQSSFFLIFDFEREDHEEDESPIQAIEPNPYLSVGLERKANLRGEDSRARGGK